MRGSKSEWGAETIGEEVRERSVLGEGAGGAAGVSVDAGCGFLSLSLCSGIVSRAQA